MDGKTAAGIFLNGMATGNWQLATGDDNGNGNDGGGALTCR